MKSVTFASAYARRDARVAEEARLESVYTSKAYPGFESRSLRRKNGFKSQKGESRSLRRRNGFKSQKGESRSLRSFQKKVFLNPGGND